MGQIISASKPTQHNLDVAAQRAHLQLVWCVGDKPSFMYLKDVNDKWLTPDFIMFQLMPYGPTIECHLSEEHLCFMRIVE